MMVPLSNSSESVLPRDQQIQKHLNAAILHHQNSRFADAELLYKEVCKIEPNNHIAIQLSGVLAAQTGQIARSLNLLSRAISIKPDYVDALSNRGNVLQKLKRFDEAIQDYDRAISLKPDYVDALYNRGVALKELKRFDEAIADYSKAISLKPDHVAALNNRGVVLKKLKRFDEAMREFDKALSLRPDYVEALNSRGLTLLELRRFDEAMREFDKVISLNPNHAEAHWSKSLQLLRQGEFVQGWELYEWRWKRKSVSSPVRKFSKPLWLGKEDLCGKTILLHWEQGLGDVIQFSRYVKEVAKLGCKTVLEVQKPLFELMKGLEGVDELIANGSDLPPFDFYCPLLSLPLALGTTLETIPSPVSYIRISDNKRAKWLNRLGTTSKPRIGIVWNGNANHTNDHNRSIALEQMLDAVTGDYELISLQKEVRQADLSIIEQSEQLRHFGAELDDFTDTAALCELVDVIVSVDTSVAHLAGALGRPVNLLLPYNSDFRWLLDRTDSPWYPSMKLFTQESDMLWKSVLERLAIQLEALSK